MSVRTTYNLPGLHHGHIPIPTAAKVGPILNSGGIVGIDRATGEVPEDLAAQCANLFANVAAVLEAAGGTPDHIVKMTVWMADRGARDALNAEWLKMFPDGDNRPARHTLEYSTFRAPVKIQCEVMAYIP